MEEEKDLEKLTVTKLREIAKQYEEITGAHAMKKEGLIVAIHRARGEPVKAVKKDETHTIETVKKKIRALKEEKKSALEKKDKKALTLVRKKIKTYRRKTRRLAKTKKA
jgi:protein-arginine kinase activator protein McsA